MSAALDPPGVAAPPARGLSIVDDINRRVTLLVALVAIVVIAINYVLSLQSARRQVDAKADEVVAAMGEAFRVPFWDLDLSNAMEVATVFSKNDWVTYVRVRDADARPIAGIGMRGDATVFRDAEIRYGERLAGSITVGLTDAPVRQAAYRLLWGSLAMLLAVVVALYAFNRYVLRRSLQRSVDVLLERIHRIAGRRAEAAPQAVRHREVREVIDQFDAMAQQVEQREQGLRSANADLASAEAALTAHRDQLEQTVAERTRELRQEVAVRQEAEAQLQTARDAAVAANRAKSDFLAHMSHELRTPLNGILGYAQILLRQPALTPPQAEGLDTIRDCGEHLLGLINEVLDLAKIEAGRMELDEQPFALTTLLHNLVALFRQRSEDKSLRFVAALAADLPPAVHGDERKLRQVLINLLGNAVKFTRTGEVALHVQRHGGSLRFEVRDTGPGIAAEHLGQLFQPFSQVRDSGAAREGTGLGLAISRRLVHLMGGELGVTSTPGVGSRFGFELELPAVADAPPAAGALLGVSGYRGPRRRLLVVDDKAINRAVLRGMLEPLGFECVEAVDGEDCLLQVVATRFDAVLTDIVMPRLDGLEAVRRLRRMPEGRDLPVIAMSASVFAADQEQCFEVGCQAFVAKPVELERLLDVLGRSLALEWIDVPPAAAPPPAAATRIEQLPQAVAAALCEAARIGRVKGVAEQAQALEALGPPYAAYAERLRELARQFRFDEIRAAAEPFV